MLAAALSRRWWISGLVTLALAVGSSGVALAGGSRPGLGTYLLRVSVQPQTVPGHLGVRITVHGHTPITNRVTLEVFSTKAFCQPKASDEAAYKSPSKMVGKTEVEGRFDRSFPDVKAARGDHLACAYLYTNPNDTLARAHASWKVT
jgi:hypothetical protein